MDRIFSARIEDAICLLDKSLEAKNGRDVFDETCGIWHRKESAEETVLNIRNEFNDSMKRHQK
jgi:Zn-finger protein